MTLVGKASLDRRLRAIKDTRGMLRSIQLAAVREAKLRVPRKTGHLGRSITPGELTATTATVEARANYAAHVEFGTRPHVIRPRKAKTLAWASGSGRRLSGRPRKGAKLTFAKKVNHPGTKAQPFLVPGIKAAIQQVGPEGIVEKWNEAS